MITSRTLLYFVFLAFAFALGFAQGCHCGRTAKHTNVVPQVDTATKTDTVYNSAPKDSTPLHVPTLAETKPPSTGPFRPVVPRFDSSEWVRADAYTYLLSLYLAVERERDSLWDRHFSQHQWRDTARLNNGKVYFSGTTRENRLYEVSLGLDSVLKETVTHTKTVVLTKPERNKVFVGVYTAYRPYEASASVGGSLLFQQKRGMGVQLFGGISTEGKVEYGMGATYLIKAKR
jgi:hypothetical protein